MRRQLIRNIWSLALATTVSTVALVSCQNTDYPTPQPSTTGYTTTARTLIVNASNATGITALIENVVAGTTLAPGANTGYIATPVSASDQIRIQGGGGTLGTADLSAKSTFLANTNYTVFVTDSISRPAVRNSATGAVTDPGGIRLLTVTDTLTAPVTGTAKLRFFNLAPDVSSVSARLISSAGTAVATLNGRAYRATAVTSLLYTRVPVGTYTVQLYAASTAPTALTATPAASTTLTVGDGKIYTVYAQGLNRTKSLSVGTVLHN